jgi:NADH-quinone oxidoreductase subunit L
MNVLICVSLFLPLISFLFLIAFNRVLVKNLTSFIACGSVLGSFLIFSFLLYQYTNQNIETFNVTLFNWLKLPGVSADFSLTLDHLSLLMSLIITGVGFLIHVYSIGYIEHEKENVKYFAFLNFFIFSMLLLVLAGNLLLVFVGWEGVGLASYLLIGYWYTKEEAAKAATKAFVVNRIGDLGFLIGLLLTFYLFQTSDVEVISKMATAKFSHGDVVITALTLLFFVGAIGKSAQLPLHVWLPDAMAGPTPVSALIHAATMVTAGVYLIVRLHVLYLLAPLTLQIVGVVGAVTALYAALSAIAQTDLKKVLAYSTISQLGFMFLACGTGAFYSAMFHLTMHAFIKGLLFLSAGNIVHMMQGTTDMTLMGGLSKRFKITHWMFLIGTLSLAGIPPFAAFFSKDLILEQEYVAGCHTLFYIGLVSSVLTGIYLMRAYILTFRGELAEKNQDLQEAPWIMLTPVMLLAFLATSGGLLGATIGKIPILESFLKEVGISPAEEFLSHGFIASPESLMAIFGALLGVSIPALLYTKFKNLIPSRLNVLSKAFYVDELYEASVVIPLKHTSKLISNTLEPKFFVDSMDLASDSVLKTSALLQTIQNGQIRSYAAFMAIGAALMIIYFLI